MELWLGFWLSYSLPAFPRGRLLSVPRRDFIGFLWAPCWGALNLYLRPWQQGTPKLLVLITQKDSWPDSGMWSPLGSRQAWAKMKACLSFLLRMCCAHANSADECPLLFCTGPHTHTHCKPHVRFNTHPNTHRHNHMKLHTLRHPVPNVLWQLFKTPRAPKWWKVADISEELYHADLLMALVATSDFMSQMFFCFAWTV